MKLFGGYRGKRVKKNKFQLCKQKKGKRLVQKPNGFCSYAVQLICGKIKYLSNKLREFSEYIDDFDEMDFEHDDFSTQEISDGEKKNNLKIVDLTIHSLSDIGRVISYVEKGYATIANYDSLTVSERSEFDKRLSMGLMRLGTHLTHISESQIICAGREILIEDNISSKKYGECIDIFGKNEEPLPLDLSEDRKLAILEEYFASLNSSTCSIMNFTIHSLSDVEDIVYYVEEGYITIANYGLLKTSERSEFDKRLSIELMRLGTHLAHVSNSEIICARSDISIEDNISEKKSAQVYVLNAIKR